MPGIRQKLELHGKRKRHDQSQGLQEGQNLSKKLLQLWSLGKLSSSGLQELASAAASDGLQHEEVMQQNAIGTFGQYPNNCHRDLLRLLKNKLKPSKYGGLKESPTISIQVPALDPKEENPNTKAACHIVRPHLLFWQFFDSYPSLAPALFGLPKLKAFWEGP